MTAMGEGGRTARRVYRVGLVTGLLVPLLLSWALVDTWGPVLRGATGAPSAMAVVMAVFAGVLVAWTVFCVPRTGWLAEVRADHAVVGRLRGELEFSFDSVRSYLGPMGYFFPLPPFVFFVYWIRLSRPLAARSVYILIAGSKEDAALLDTAFSRAVRTVFPEPPRT